MIANLMRYRLAVRLARDCIIAALKSIAFTLFESPCV